MNLQKMTSKQIIPTQLSDFDFMCALVDAAVAYQISNKFPVWHHFDYNSLKADCLRKQQYKVVLEDQIGCVFTMSPTDIVWDDLDGNQAFYLHRVLVNPLFKGQKLFGVILEWALEKARQANLNWIRLDTWADNPVLIKYYEQFGLQVIGDRIAPDADDLPPQQRNNHIVLMQMKV